MTKWVDGVKKEYAKKISLRRRLRAAAGDDDATTGPPAG